MNTRPKATDTPRPTALHQHAEDNLRFIRATMENATAFTDVSGSGYVLAGISAFVAAAVASRQDSATAWLTVWMLELVFAGAVTLFLTARKAKARGKSLWSNNGKKLLFAFIPAMAAGAFMTLALYRLGTIDLLPGLWLSLYGAAVMTAGAYSVRIIPVMGALFMLLGALVLLVPVPANLVLGLGMGGLHTGFGIIIWRHHGG